MRIPGLVWHSRDILIDLWFSDCFVVQLSSAYSCLFLWLKMTAKTQNNHVLNVGGGGDWAMGFLLLLLFFTKKVKTVPDRIPLTSHWPELYHMPAPRPMTGKDEMSYHHCFRPIKINPPGLGSDPHEQNRKVIARNMGKWKLGIYNLFISSASWWAKSAESRSLRVCKNREGEDGYFSYHFCLDW